MKGVFNFFIFEVDIVLETEELKLNTKQCTIKERTHLFTFTKFIKQN